MAPVSGPRFWDHNELTGEGINGIISYWPASQKTHWHDARICLGETWTDAFNRSDLCYSFKVLYQAEYGEPDSYTMQLRIMSVIMGLSGYHADTPITIKAEASNKADSHPN